MGSTSVVMVRFKPLGDAVTKVSITHTGWGESEDWNAAYDYFCPAWHHVLTSLKNCFEPD